MNIVIEGPDGSGKTTLANVILQHVPLTYKGTEGPEKFHREIIERTYRYLRLDGMIFDRHPCVSQPIYGRFRPNSTEIPVDLIGVFYRQRNLIIYCHGSAGVHETKEYDTPEHVDMIGRHDQTIRDSYDKWAAKHAMLTYSVKHGDLDAIITACKEYYRDTY